MAMDLLNRRFMETRGGKLPLIERSVPLTGGMNTRVAPQHLPDGTASYLENVDLSDPFVPKLRDGYGLIGSAQTSIDAALLAKRINSMGALSPTGTTATSLIITIPNAAAGRTYRTTDTTSAWSECLTGGAASYDPGAAVDVPTAQAADCYYILGTVPAAIDTAGLVVLSTSTAEIAPATGGSPPTTGVDLAYLLGRLWILTSDCYLAYSKFQPTAASINSDWAATGVASFTTSVASRLAVSPNSSQVARGLIAWNGTSLLCFYDNSIEEVIIGDASDPFSDASRHVLEPRFGLIGRRAKAVIGQEVIFMDQFGAVRTLTQTVNGTQAGVTPLPLSEAMDAEFGRDGLTGRINLGAANRIHFQIVRNRLLIFYPRDSSTECNAVAVYNLALRYWEGVWPTAHEQGCSCVSDIRGNGSNGFELFATNGSTTTPLSKVYRWFNGGYTDDGTTYEYVEMTRGFPFEAFENPKLFGVMELDGMASAGMQALVALQIDEDGVFQESSQTWTGVALPGDFPLTSSSFPLTASSFPLTDSVLRLVRRTFSFEEMDEIGHRGRFARIRIRSRPRNAGDFWQRHGYRLTAKMEAVDWILSDDGDVTE